MWPFQIHPVKKKYLEDPRVKVAAENWRSGFKHLVRHLCRFSEEDGERLIQIYQSKSNFNNFSWRDPVEATPEYVELLEDINNKVDEILKKEGRSGMGTCHSAWRIQKQLLVELGIKWFKPTELNPQNRYD
jgi:hypothetical protein